MATDWDDPAVWQGAYGIRDRDPSSPTFGSRLGYSRVAMVQVLDPSSPSLSLYAERRDRLIADYGIQPSESILVAGGGYGFLAEVFLSAGYGRVYSLDGSAVVEAGMAAETAPEVVPRMVAVPIQGAASTRAALKVATKAIEGPPGYSTFDWVVTEDLLPGYSTAEVGVILDACEVGLDGTDLARIVHLVTTPLPPPWTDLSLEDWAALRPAHSWTSIRLSQWRTIYGT